MKPILGNSSPACHSILATTLRGISQRGWQGCFSQGYLSDACRDVDRYTLRRLRTHLRRRSQRAYKKPATVTWWSLVRGFRVSRQFISARPTR
jgi:hypothetical protein